MKKQAKLAKIENHLRQVAEEIAKLKTRLEQLRRKLKNAQSKPPKAR